MRGVWVFAGLVLVHVAAAQESINYWSIGGRVTDPSAAVVEGGHFIARQVETNLKSLQNTDHDGVNARLSRSFAVRERVRLECMAEAFNLLNHLNGVTLNGTFGGAAHPTSPLPTFKQITAVADPRTLQLALWARF